ncbi:hypothetical protein FHX75_121266 [Micromonospora palomenae]|uniref:Uncharacterized protein n=1 Tax=Micromonospora palomenae TaxID=1461247 RepID=A0A561WFT5_9ACTN|nr:hypothetical protein [Micromonospora palomenae]TWG22733.1 hypothetical protein FHX75_121266 [Micromonospora palomenae]
MRKFRTLLGATLAGACALAVVPGTASAAPAAAPQQATADLADTTGAYYEVSPARLMDTREGLGAPKAKIGPLAKVDLQVAGRGGVPTAGVGAVVLNVTITGPTMDSFVTAYPAGVTRPDASSVNFAKGWLGSNNVTVKLGTGGKVSVYNRNGYTDVVVDVVGYYAKDNSMTNRNGGQYEWYEPDRAFDTRTDPEGKPPAGTTLEYALDFGPERNPHMRTLVTNLTAVAPASAGFLTAWSGATAKPTASTVNYGAGRNVPNTAFIQTTPCTGAEPFQWCTVGSRKFKIFTSASAHVLVDVVGAVDDGFSPYGMRFAPMSPTRIVDSRTNLGTTGAMGPGSVRRVTVPGTLRTPDTGVAVMNVTAVKPTNNTVITVWPADIPEIPKPSTSNLNPYANQVVSNAVLGIIEPNGVFNVHNLSGSTHVVADMVGTFYYPAAPAATLSGDAGKSKPQFVGASHR